MFFQLEFSEMLTFTFKYISNLSIFPLFSTYMLPSLFYIYARIYICTYTNVLDNSEYNYVLITLLRGNVSFYHPLLCVSAVQAFLASCITNGNSQRNRLRAIIRL